jgi:hypothetical protein
MLANLARRWRLLATVLAAGLGVMAGWPEFALGVRVALLVLMMLLLAVAYFKKNLLIWTQLI